MRQTNTPCSSCGQPLYDIAGLGERAGQLICNNSSCTSHYRHVACPTCGKAPAAVKVLGLGHQHFQCADAHVWSSIPGQ